MSLDARGVDIVSLLDFPESLREGRANVPRRAESGLADLLDVLGQQKLLDDLASGGDLTFGQLPLLALVLVLFSSLLLVGAVMPPGVVARTPLSQVRYEALREPLALAAIGILVPVAAVALAIALG